jgi:hypothetical protein
MTNLFRFRIFFCFMKRTHIIAILFTAMLFVASPVYAAGQEADGAARLFPIAEAARDNRVTILRAYLHTQDSPLTDDAATFIREADNNHIDWRLVAAIAGVESTFGKHIPGGSYNAWGWGVFTGEQDGIHFDNWADGIAQVSEGLRKNYIDKGATDIYDIGWIYAANGNSWGSHVTFFLDKIANFTPADPIALDVAI